MRLVGVAIDAQGPHVVHPYLAEVQFPNVVDAEGRLEELLGFKAVPNVLLIDETGTLRFARFGSFDIRRPDHAATIRELLESTDLPSSGPSDPARFRSPAARALFRRGLSLHRSGRRAEALEIWRRAIAEEPDNFVVRKQIWAVEHPERFYTGDIDLAWQREQIAQGR